MREIWRRVTQKIREIRKRVSQRIGKSWIYQKIREWLFSAMEKANQGTYGRLLLDGGAAVSLSSAIAATLNIWTGFFKNPVIEDTFKGSDGLTLFAAILLLPTGIISTGGVKVVMTGLKWAFNVKELERGRQEGRQEGQQEFIEAATGIVPPEMLAQVQERVREVEQEKQKAA